MRFDIKMLQSPSEINMRAFEIVIPILLAAFLLWRSPRPVWIQFFPVFALLAIVIHLLIEGYRWQMIPLYVLTLVIALSALMKFRSSDNWRPAASYLTFFL